MGSEFGVQENDEAELAELGDAVVDEGGEKADGAGAGAGESQAHVCLEISAGVRRSSLQLVAEGGARSRREKMRERWTLRETLALIACKQKQMGTACELGAGGRVNGKERKWHGIEKQLAVMGVQRTAVECTRRWENIFSWYKRIIDNEGRPDVKSFWEMTPRQRREAGLKFAMDRSIFNVIDSMNLRNRSAANQMVAAAAIKPTLTLPPASVNPSPTGIANPNTTPTNPNVHSTLNLAITPTTSLPIVTTTFNPGVSPVFDACVSPAAAVTVHPAVSLTVNPTAHATLDTSSNLMHSSDHPEPWDNSLGTVVNTVHDDDFDLGGNPIVAANGHPQMNMDDQQQIDQQQRIDHNHHNMPAAAVMVMGSNNNAHRRNHHIQHEQSNSCPDPSSHPPQQAPPMAGSRKRKNVYENGEMNFKEVIQAIENHTTKMIASMNMSCSKTCETMIQVAQMQCSVLREGVEVQRMLAINVAEAGRLISDALMKVAEKLASR